MKTTVFISGLRSSNKQLYQLYPDKYNAYLSAKKTIHPKTNPKPNQFIFKLRYASIEPLPTNNKPSTISILSELQIEFLPFKITGVKSMHLQKYTTSKDFVIVTRNI